MVCTGSAHGVGPTPHRRLGTPLPTAEKQRGASEAALKLSRASVSPRQLEVSVSRTRSTQDAAPEPLCSLPRLVLVACIAHPHDADFSVCEASRSRAAKIILIDDVSVSRTRSTRPAAPEPLGSLPRLVLVACIGHPVVRGDSCAICHFCAENEARVGYEDAAQGARPLARLTRRHGTRSRRRRRNLRRHFPSILSSYARSGHGFDHNSPRRPSFSTIRPATDAGERPPPPRTLSSIF